MDLQISSGGNVAVSDDVFAAPFREDLIHQVVTAYMAGARTGTKAQKSRSDVSGGGRKPWRQKGTGRARAGTIRSPIWRSGGVTFAASPRNYEQKINRKMFRAAMRSILAELVRQERLIVTDDLTIAEPKTKLLIEKLNSHGTNVLIVSADIDENLYLASRNLPYIGVTDVAGVDPVSLVGHEKVIITSEAVKELEERLA